MPDDILPFLAGLSFLVIYLLWSAATEMGTRWPWRSRQNKTPDQRPGAER